MKNIILTALLLLLTAAHAVAEPTVACTKPGSRFSAGTLSGALQKFDKLQAGPFINVVLQEGESEHIRIDYSGIDPEKINYEVKGKKLSIYLDDAKYLINTEKVNINGSTRKVPIYRGAEITAYVTYNKLKSIQLSGEQSLSCDDPLISKKFKIRLLGETRLQLASLETRQLKVRLFGENSLVIKSGEADVQTYRLFGENKVDTENMAGYKISTSLLGENTLNLYASEEIKLWGIGEVRMQYAGDPHLSKFMLGTSTINQK